jgi:penicillin amidase
LLAACGGGGAHADVERSVTIKRDGYGVPHVYASNTRGLFHGFGYAVAEDRLYQLEMAKRSGNGSVAEVLGANYAALDATTRSGLDPASIKSQLLALSDADRAMFEGYAAGVNARIKDVLANQGNLLPKEFSDAGFLPTEWSAEDVALVWIGLILNRFFGGSSEVSNQSLLNTLKTAQGATKGQQIYDQLRWLEDPTAPTIIPRASAVANVAPGVPVAELVSRSAKGKGKSSVSGAASPNRLVPISAQAAAAHRSWQVTQMGLAATENMPTASNAWVLAPAKTADGHAILYNGPQQGFNNPAFVHGIGLHGAGYDLTGSTPIGLLAVLFGTNGTIAWGSTVGSLDTNDTYQETLNPANQYEYRFNGAYVPMTKRVDIIKVKGEADRSVDVYATVHGFVSTWDVANGTAYTAKRSWQGREIETLIGWAQAAKSQNWDQYMAQAARVSASITWFYADVQGNIGAAGLGSLPNRVAAQDIRFPAKGDGTMEWQGFLPFTENPKSFNPSQAYLVSWNNQIAAGLRADGANFTAVDRVNELNSQLAAKAKFTADEVWKVASTAAVADLNARYFIPYIVAATASLAGTDPLRQAADRLASWDMQIQDTDHDGTYDGAGTTILRAWLAEMTGLVLADDLPASVLGGYTNLGYPTSAVTPGSVSPASASKVLLNALRGPSSGVVQTYDFLNGRDPQTVVREALNTAVVKLTSQYGGNMDKWLTPVAKHGFSAINAVGVPWAAANQTVEASNYLNRGTVNFRVAMAPGAVKMCSVLPAGQSGFISPRGERDVHYADQLSLFEVQTCKQDWLTRQEVDAAATSTKTLSY